VTIAGPLYALDFAHLQDDRDWFFPVNEQGVQHFECLFRADEMRRRGAEAVLKGLQIHKSFEETALSMLHRLGLQPGNFDALHFTLDHHKRRQDWPKRQKAIFAESSAKLKSLLAGRPVLMISKETLTLPEMGPVTLTRPTYDSESSLFRTVLDMILCSYAHRFVGSSNSIWSTGVHMLRLRRKLVGENLSIQDHGIYEHDSGSVMHMDDAGQCLRKYTDFRDVLHST